MAGCGLGKKLLTRTMMANICDKICCYQVAKEFNSETQHSVRKFIFSWHMLSFHHNDYNSMVALSTLLALCVENTLHGSSNVTWKFINAIMGKCDVSFVLCLCNCCVGQRRLIYMVISVHPQNWAYFRPSCSDSWLLKFHYSIPKCLLVTKWPHIKW